MHTKRHWGAYEIIEEFTGIKIKKLTINSGATLSLQRHQKRDEYWFINNGQLLVEILTPNFVPKNYGVVNNGMLKIEKGHWHRFTNIGEKHIHIIEVQMGICEEEDIERLTYYVVEQKKN